MCVWQINLAEIKAIEHGTITYFIFDIESKPTVMSTKVMMIKSQTSQSNSNPEHKVYELSYLVHISAHTGLLSCVY